MTTEKQQELFAQLITMFQFAALQHMGKLKNPATDAVEQDLTQAQFAIDMLDMLQTKTRNNLAPEEERAVSAMLHDLRLNYVDEVNKAQAAQPKS